jgi:ribonucleoside-diphosphate reductase alpha chain
VSGYLVSGMHEDGDLGEFFIKIAKDGSTLTGLVDAMATITSIALQYGVPLKALTKKMMHRKFEPAGFTDNPQLRTTTSLVDYIFKYLALKFCDDDELEELGLKKVIDRPEDSNGIGTPFSVSANPCPECGALMKRLGSCEHCGECGFNGGSCG